MTLELIALLALVAFFAGAIDAMAGGGGMLTLPALMAAGVPPVAAIATNKLQATMGTASAFWTYYRAGHVDLRRFAVPTLGAFVGAAGGAAAVQVVDSGFLTVLVPILLIAIALYFLLAPPMSDVDRRARLGTAGFTLITTGIGFYDGFFGPGTGSFLTTAMVALAGLGLVRAIANTKLINLMTNVAALVAMVIGGQVLWLLGFAMAGANILGAQLGARLAMRYSGRGVRPLLVVICLALTIKLLADPANPLRQMLAF